MQFGRYIKDKLFVIVLGLAVYAIFMMMLVAFQVEGSLMSAFTILFGLFFVTTFLWEYLRRKRFYDELLRNIDRLEEKYLVLETLQGPSFYEGELLNQILYETGKSMKENVNRYAMSMTEFKEYIEMWIHEVKIPISSLVLMCHNEKGTLDKKYISQIRRLDNYVDQVLYYVRAQHSEKDYRIKEVKLSDVVRNVAIHNKDDLLEHEINLTVENVDITVVTDAKWLEFIVNQLVNNALKYQKKEPQKIEQESHQIEPENQKIEQENPQIEIRAEENEKLVTLHVRDNGIGIPAADMGRVFEKSFTGENGRIFAKSTGMGLYIAKRLCNQLGHSISISSRQGEYTDVCIGFAKNDYYRM
jgi:signal transduction histidine kinase